VLRKKADVAVLGAGPAGLSAGIAIANAGMQVLVIDESPRIGGQLPKQTHKFFGSVDQYAGVRGVDIARELEEQANSSGVEFSIRSSVLSLTRRQNGQFVVDFNRDDRLTVVETPAVIIATGASERMIPFPNNDLPGVYGAGAVQTLVNIYGVRPGSRVLMVGAGNVGLIVSYQLLQADISVVAVVESMPRIGGYQVHASKLRRCGVPIYTSHSILRAVDSDRVEGAVIAPLDEEGNTLEAKARELDVDTICLAVGLSPSVEVLRAAKVPCRMIPELGGFVPLHSPFMATLIDGLYVAGDAAGIGEASTAMVEGEIAGMSAVLRARKGKDAAAERARKRALEELESLRSGPTARVIAHGKKRVFQAFRSAR
jgi:sarcosine oxidase subunit alpha